MTINPRLHHVVAAQPYPLLFAIISGAHLYGFPSPDSDFDLRSAHVLPIDHRRDGKGDELVRACRVTRPALKIIAGSSHVAGNSALLKAGASAVCGKMEFDKIADVIKTVGGQPEGCQGKM